MKARILVVDDEQSMQDFLRLLLEGEGYHVATASSVAEGKEIFHKSGYDLVLCDILMPDGNGLEVLKSVKQAEPGAAVIMMTAYTSTKTAIEAMKLGAYDYIPKPFDVEEIKVIIEKALEKTELQAENVYLRKELEQRYAFSNIVGRSSRMQKVFSLIERVAKTNSTVLIFGESGTGKELIARALHYESPRAKNRFLSINCGALPETLLESELFGHTRGAFTGAVRDKKGLFQEAAGGTLFLDEIGEMTLAMQVKLLRALQERKIRRVGDNREIDIDVRIITATNRDLKEMISTGTFREDLYYRINVIPIQLPPLRQRTGDIPLLVDFFINKYGEEMSIEPPKVSAEAMKNLESYRWPGNVRELENAIERALALCDGSIISSEDIPMHLAMREGSFGDGITLPKEGLDLEAHLDEIRRHLMSQALEQTAGVQTQAAELLGMTFRSFRYYAKKMGLTRTGDEDDES